MRHVALFLVSYVCVMCVSVLLFFLALYGELRRAARNFALLLLGFVVISSSVARMGFFVSISSCGVCSQLHMGCFGSHIHVEDALRKYCLTIRSSRL